MAQNSDDPTNCWEAVENEYPVNIIDEGMFVKAKIYVIAKMYVEAVCENMHREMKTQQDLPSCLV